MDEIEVAPEEDARLNELIPGYMPMGASGMGDMPDMGKPRNTLLMGSHEGRAKGPFGSIFMGGMFTILKVREGLANYDEDPGWYENPPGTVASPVGERQALGAPASLPARQIAALSGAGGKRATRKAPRTRKMSAKGRAAISRAAKKRWAAWRKAKAK